MSGRSGPWMLAEPCRRKNGSLRAWSSTKDEAERFAVDPANVNYHGDVAHFCPKREFWHLSRPEWLFPEWETLRDNAVTN
jgi:hypothetical protein